MSFEQRLAHAADLVMVMIRFAILTSSISIWLMRLYSAVTSPWVSEPMLTCIAPVQMRRIIAAFTIISVSGLSTAETLPTLSWSEVSKAFLFSNSASSSSSQVNARSTLTPFRFSLTFPVSESRERCALVCMGMEVSMTANTTMQSSTMTRAKMSADFVSMTNAAAIAPNTTNGERSSRRSA